MDKTPLQKKISPFYYTLALSSFLTVAVIVWLLIFPSATQTAWQKQTQLALQKNTLMLLSSQINQQIQQLQQTTTQLIQKNDLINVTELSDLQALNKLQASLYQVQSIEFFPINALGVAGLKQLEKVSTIQRSLIAKTIKSQQSIVDVYQYNGDWSIVITVPILNTGIVQAVAIAYYPITIITTNFPQNPYQVGLYDAFDQTIIKAVPTELAQKLTAGLKVTVGLDKNISMLANVDDIIVSMVIFLIISLFIIFLVFYLYQRAVKDDIVMLTQFIKSQTGLHTPNPPSTLSSPFTPLIKALVALSSHIIKTAVTEQQGQSVTKNQMPSTPLPLSDVAETSKKTLPDFVFRDYDIRGPADLFQGEPLLQLTQAIASFAIDQKHKTLVVGADCRISSPEIKESLIAGLIESGMDVIDIGIVPTPLLYFACHHLKTQAGVMITASHNDKGDNGFKIVIQGQSLQAQAIQQLKDLCSQPNPASGKGKVQTSSSIADAYLTALNTDIIISRPLKVVVDAANGAGGPLAIDILSALDCEMIPLYCNMDGHFPHHSPDPCKPSNLQTLIEKVASEGADLGIALDGDADRLIAITPSGKILFGDTLLMLFSQEIVSHTPGTHVIFDIKCSSRLARFITSLGGRPMMTKTGHSNIKALMHSTDALLGGEYTGHFCFADRWLGFDDGLYAMARLIEVLSMHRLSLDEIINEFEPIISSTEMIISLQEQDKFTIINQLKAQLLHIGGKVIETDGIRVELANSWGLIRASNTQEALTARFEGETQADLDSIINQFQLALSQIDPELLLIQDEV